MLDESRIAELGVGTFFNAAAWFCLCCSMSRSDASIAALRSASSSSSTWAGPGVGLVASGALTVCGTNPEVPLPSASSRLICNARRKSSSNPVSALAARGSIELDFVMELFLNVDRSDTPGGANDLEFNLA